MPIRHRNLLSSFVASESSYNPSNLTVERVLDASSNVDQSPTGLGVANAKQISFGAAQKTGSDPVNLLADGSLVINETGLYRLQVSFQLGRESGSTISQLYLRVLVNDVQQGRSIAFRIDNTHIIEYQENNAWVELPAGTTLKYEIMRDSSYADDGGLLYIEPTVEAGSWNPSPSAFLRVERLINR